MVYDDVRKHMSPDFFLNMNKSGSGSRNRAKDESLMLAACMYTEWSH